MSADLNARRRAAAAELADFNRELHSAPLSKPPGREWMFGSPGPLRTCLTRSAPPRHLATSLPKQPTRRQSLRHGRTDGQ